MNTAMHATSPVTNDASDEMNLGDVAAMVRLADVDVQARRNMASAINTIGRVLDRDIRDIPAHAPTLRMLLSKANPEANGISPTHWRNTRSSLNRAMKALGLTASVAWALPHDQAWEPIISALGVASERSGLRRFARFCTQRKVPPNQVNEDLVKAYLNDLERSDLCKTPARIVRDLVRMWNRIAASDERLQLPRLSSSSVNTTYTRVWAELPPGLTADAAEFYAKSLAPDWFEAEGHRRPVKIATADQRDRMLRRLATAEILNGVKFEQLTSLSRLVEPSNLRRGLEFMINRNDGRPNKQVFEMALLAQTIGRHWAALPPGDLAVLKQWVSKFRPQKSGMTEKNRSRLRQFTGGDMLRRLVQLPTRVFASLSGKPVTPTTAREAQRATAIAILLAAPMRLKNLRMLDRTRHFHRALSVTDDSWRLELPAAEVKNGVGLAYPMPPEVMDLIEEYMSRYQPVLAKLPTDTLFPGRKPGTRSSDTGMRKIISDWLRKRLGVEMNPHLFRHLSALIFLNQNPGQYESVRQLLGHKNLQTTIEFYAGFEADEAMRRFASILHSLRDNDGARAAPSV